MATPFGFSIGDFIAAINLGINIVSALSSTSKSAAQYRGLLSELYVLEKALIGVKNLNSLDQDQSFPANIEALHHASHFAASQCQKTVDRLLAKLKPYESHLATNGKGKKWTSRWRKVQWALLTEGEIEEFRVEIRGHICSINVNLNLTQLEMLKLQSQSTRNGQERTMNSIQNGYTNTMLNLTSALGQLGKNSDKLLEATDVIVRSNSRVLQEVLHTQQIVTLPPGINERKPVTFIDAFGKETHFYLDFVYSPMVLQDWLKRRFSGHGFEKVIKMEYAIEDLKTKRQITLSNDWETLQPGMYLGMDFIYSWILQKGKDGKWSICPGCEEKCAGDIDTYIVCHNCGVQFKHLNNVPEHSKEDKFNVQLREIAFEELESDKKEQQCTKRKRKKSGSLGPVAARKQLHQWYQYAQIEKTQMQAFRRFRFQPTRAESDLAEMDLFVLGWVLTERHTGYEFQKELREKAGNGGLVGKPANRFHGLNNLALLLELLGESETSEKIFLTILEEIEGSSDLNLGLSTAVTCNLAKIKADRGEYQDASTLLSNTCHVARASGINFSTILFTAILNSYLSRILWLSGDFGSSIDLMKQAVDSFGSLALEPTPSTVVDTREDYQTMLFLKKNHLLGRIEELS